MRWGCIIALLVVGTAGAQDSRDSVARACRGAIAPLSKLGIRTTFVAVDAETGAVIASHRAQEGLIPASVQKILTSSAALLGPGADHAIYTDLLTHGTRRGGVLTGVLRLRGEGDPTLRAEAVLPVLVGRVRRAGLTRIVGDLIIDDRVFDREFYGPAWPKDRPSRPFMAQVAGLSLDEGTVRVEVVGAAAAGAAARLTIAPAGAVATRGKVITTSKKSDKVIWADRRRDEDRLNTGGRVFRNSRVKAQVAVHDPAIVFGRALRRALADGGIVVTGKVRRPGAEEYRRGGHLVARIKTRVAQVLRRLLENSQNHRAEMLFKHLGFAVFEDGSFRGGGEAVRKILGGEGVDLTGAVIADGSGLSRDNRVSARQLAAALRAVWRSSFRPTFVDALAFGGEPGSTMRRRLRSLGRRVTAKTGTLTGVKGLAGHVKTVGGRTVIFAVVMNSKRGDRNGTMAAAQNKLVLALARLRSGS